MQLFLYATVPATLSVERFMSPDGLTKLLYCWHATVSHCCVNTVITFINSYQIFCLLIHHSISLSSFPLTLQDLVYYNRILCSVFTVYFFGWMSLHIACSVLTFSAVLVMFFFLFCLSLNFLLHVSSPTSLLLLYNVVHVSYQRIQSVAYVWVYSS